MGAFLFRKPVLIPPWSNARLLFENAGKVGSIVKADSEGNVGDAEHRVLKKRLRLLDAVGIDVLHRGHSRLALEEAAKIVLVKMKALGKRRRGDVLVAVVGDVGNDLADTACLVLFGFRLSA